MESEIKKVPKDLWRDARNNSNRIKFYFAPLLELPLLFISAETRSKTRAILLPALPPAPPERKSYARGVSDPLGALLCEKIHAHLT